jgi:cellulose biosynthesis protein BcsQ
LTVTSHKGGAGRTTFALGLAWLWGQRGLKVTLVDADPVQAAMLVACGPAGCGWANVTPVGAADGAVTVPAGQDAVVIDSPPATEPLAQGALRKADGVVLCCLADSLALGTLPAATRAVREAKAANPALELLGIVVSAFNPTDLGQTRCLSLLRGAHGGLFAEPPVPLRPEFRDWPLSPGADLPDGPGRVALKALADGLRDRVVDAGWPQFANAKRDGRARAARR